MGIANLLPMFRSSMTKFLPENFAGRRCAVDGFSWLYSAIRGCGRQLLKDTTLGCDQYLHHVMQKILLLQRHNIEVTVVFDGKSLPAKKRTQVNRRVSRSEKLRMALQADEEGKYDLANKYFDQAVTVTSRMVSNWIRLLKQNGAKYVVAPYEADAQMAYLARSKTVDFVMTEDADMILYECPCIVFKFDSYGNGDLFYLSYLSHNTNEHDPITPYLLRQACILAMCDYFEGLPGVGLKSAIKMVNQHSTIVDALKFFCKTRPHLDFEAITRGYFMAESTFQNQVILDNHQRCCRLSAALGKKQNDTEDSLSFAGELSAFNDLTSRTICVLGIADVDTGFVPCESDFFLHKVDCSSCQQKHLDCQCVRQPEHVWYRDAFLCQATYEHLFVYAPPSNPMDEMPLPPRVIFAQTKSSPSNYKKRRVSYIETEEGEDIFEMFQPVNKKPKDASTVEPTPPSPTLQEQEKGQ